MHGLLLLWLLVPSLGWNRWDYSTEWSDVSPEEALAIQREWLSIWGVSPSGVDSSGPRPRRGHSLVLYQSPNAFPYFGDTYIVMFGGRDNDENTTHVPKTYDLESVNGSLQFTTYDQKPVNPCNDVNGTFYSAEERSSCPNTTSPDIIPVGVYYNDVWAYKLCRKYKINYFGLYDFYSVNLPTVTSTALVSRTAGSSGTQGLVKEAASISSAYWCAPRPRSGTTTGRSSSMTARCTYTGAMGSGVPTTATTCGCSTSV